MKIWLATHLLTVLVACSYVVLGIVASSVAQALWAPYAGLVLVLAILNLAQERHAARSR